MRRFFCLLSCCERGTVVEEVSDGVEDEVGVSSAPAVDVETSVSEVEHHEVGNDLSRGVPVDAGVGLRPATQIGTVDGEVTAIAGRYDGEVAGHGELRSGKEALRPGLPSGDAPAGSRSRVEDPAGAKGVVAAV